MSPHIELFPPLDSLYSTLSHQRRSHSTPSTPISTQTPFFPPPFFPPSSAAPPSELRLSRAPSIDYRGGTPMLRTVSDFGPGNFFAGSPSEEELCRLPETAGLQASLFKSVVGRVR